MRILREQAVGLCVDMQERLYPAMAEPDCAERTRILIAGLRVLEVPVLATEQYRKGLGETIAPIREALGGISPIEKVSFSCMDEPVFHARLAGLSRDTVIIAGIEAHVCVLQTALDLHAEGYRPVVVVDAVSSRQLRDKAPAIDRMRASGVVVTTVESILFELCRVSRTEVFKAISALVK